ncbi:MAG: glycosyl hydrolase family protein [Mesorhizobium sp.]|uniref:family 16 glycosylhydrolase n=1 Tax=Mesorhizobium sp. TaxID=1871066 RepID=UPI00120F4E83|nr:family 16 glycosylhydrolase [Mesorhizobium sp.]TIL84405.1 MAG: glycosyl hydrolase family protein [Mesorhizobium sp.]
MNLRRASGLLSKFTFRAMHAASSIMPGGQIDAFGSGRDKIEAIMVINLDRQPGRCHRVKRELGRFRTGDGASLTSIVKRFAAIDARDGRAVAATADVDPNYRIGDQLYVQPDPRLSACFDVDEPVRMTRQETAVARSHIEVWKTIATGPHKYVLVLEDDVWFRRGAATSINRGWQAALRRRRGEGPRLLYLSYSNAGGSAERADVCDALFRPVRGLWFLSGYVLSREGAAALLRAMPVVGPVDMWINYYFDELGALALSSPAILQRPDGASDNIYSVLPYLARAGIVDAGSGAMSPHRTRVGPLVAWSSGGERESLAMALSMLGLRVRAFDGHEEQVQERYLQQLFGTFDALIDPPLANDAFANVLASEEIKLIFEADAAQRNGIDPKLLPSSRTAILRQSRLAGRPWEPLCTLLGVAEPTDAFPAGAQRRLRLFRDDRSSSVHHFEPPRRGRSTLIDESPWVLPPEADWRPLTAAHRPMPHSGRSIVHEPMTSASLEIRSVVETFPGNLAVFAHDSITYDDRGANIRISEKESGHRLYQSGALASKQFFDHGRFEAEIRAAPGAGLVTGFFLHRDAPRQEIDVELAGNDPRRMLINVYFNPGDAGAAMGFGYRGSPCNIDLGFDSTLDFHLYAIDWQPGRIAWSVDGMIVHERVGWDPTPLPHLPMRLHANLWAPRSEKLAGRVNKANLPLTATFRNISVSDTAHHKVVHRSTMELGASA